jgi:hypothetical protein
MGAIKGGPVLLSGSDAVTEHMCTTCNAVQHLLFIER